MDIKGILYLAVSLLLIYACYTDVKKRKISNKISLIVMVLSLILMFFHREWTVLWSVAGVLTIGFFLSQSGTIGAGDVKLACALLPGLPQADGVDFLLLTGFAGIPVSLITLAYYKIKGRGKKVSIPYGLAITGGYGLQLYFS